MAKRILDFFVAGLMLLMLILPMLILALQIYRKLGGPIFFAQVRPGLREQPFTMFKFRTMNDECDRDGVLLPDEQRLTTFGQWLRSTSLDELPELWNVLKGDMSMVGPRPLLMEYLPLYSFQQARRHEVRPGITGWAQINGRNAISWEEKFELDLWYVNNRNFWLDIKILWLTVRKVLKREGINAEGEATTARFSGDLAKRGFKE